MDTDRVAQLERWLSSLYPGIPFSLAPASADASFRRYFRAAFPDGASAGGVPRTAIVMDAPPPHDDSE